MSRQVDFHREQFALALVELDPYAIGSWACGAPTIPGAIMSFHPAPDASSASTPGSSTERRARWRVIARRVSIVVELLLLAFGAIELWRASAAGQPISRPGQIAFWAGIVGLLANLLASTVRARAERGRAAERAG